MRSAKVRPGANSVKVINESGTAVTAASYASGIGGIFLFYILTGGDYHVFV